jgi:hypothetical protein
MPRGGVLAQCSMALWHRPCDFYGQAYETNRALVDVELLKTQHAPVSVAKAESFVAVAVAVNDQVNVNDNDNDNAGERERDCGSCE